MLLDFLGRPTAKREIRTDIREDARIAADADGTFRRLGLTVVCMHCGGTPTGGNAPTDATWKLECACSVRLLGNPRVKGRH